MLNTFLHVDKYIQSLARNADLAQEYSEAALNALWPGAPVDGKESFRASAPSLRKEFPEQIRLASSLDLCGEGFLKTTSLT